MLLNKNVMMIPESVGTKNEIMVHFVLWVSLRIVSKVVAHGECIKVNSSVLIAVTTSNRFGLTVDLKRLLPILSDHFVPNRS